jgi:cell wall assembly regulator SMI1
MKKLIIRGEQNPVSEASFKAFESKFSLSLPKTFKAFISLHDQPWIEGNHFRFTNIFANDYSWVYKIVAGVDSRDLNFLGFNDTAYSGEYIFDAQDFDIYGHDQVIAFGSSANGDYICFDYRHAPTTDEPRVVLMFHDTYDKNNKMLICPIANSFEAFMDSLYKPED